MSLLNNTFTKFNTTSEYEAFKVSSGYTKPNVSWIVNENNSKTQPWMPPPLMSGVVIHKDGEFREVSYDNFNTHYDDIVSSGYTIEGAIAVPSTHTPDGTTRIISLKYMSCITPETGSLGVNYIYWGNDNKDIPGLTNHESIAKISNVEGETGITSDTKCYIPSDNFKAIQGTTSCVADDKAAYHSYTGTRYAPSPYVTGDEPNLLYRMTTDGNALSDFDGSGNTELIVANATAQTNWRTDETITNSTATGYYPAACCCKRYATSGLPAGNWYLPSAGELGYVMARLKTINSVLSLINSKSSGTSTQVTTGNFWTSTECLSSMAIYIYMSQGLITYDYKDYDKYVRAFAAVNAKQLLF